MKILQSLQVFWALVVVASQIVAISASGQTLSPEAVEKGFRITQYLPNAEQDQAAMVVIAGGRANGIISGSVFHVYREGFFDKTAAAQKLLVQTGTIKVLELHDHMAIGVVSRNGSALSAKLFQRFPGIMVGDTAVEQRPELVAKMSITPTISLTYQELFLDPRPMPASFELSSRGEELLREMSSRFEAQHVKNLFVEGHTDRRGPADANQLESYQRALTVRQFLVAELGFDEERTTALGFGHSEPLDQSNAPGGDTAQRRIVLKAASW